MKCKVVILSCFFLCLFFSNELTAGNLTDSIRYFDASGFKILGKVYQDSLPIYSRVPEFKKEKVRKALWNLGQNSAGIAIRFRSNSSFIAADWTQRYGNSMNHMSDTGVKGLDLYTYQNGKWRFVRSGRPTGKQTKAVIIENMERKEREYMLYLPLYDGISNLRIGIDSLSYIMAPLLSYTDEKKPIVFYGSSILQGGCASRPGMVATNIIGRILNRETINLGFSGNAFIDTEMANMMSDVDASVYVLDYVPNASVEQILERTESFVQILRNKHTNVPIIFVEDPMFTHAIFDKNMAKEISEKNEAINRVFMELKQKGTKNIYMVKGVALMNNDGESTVDGIHLSDLGMVQYVDAIMPLLRKLLK